MNHVPRVHLTEEDRAKLNGELGEAMRMAMRIVVRMADVSDAKELLTISRAHIDSTVYQGLATLEYAEKLSSLGAHVSVPTSLNVSGVDEHGWKAWAVPPEWAANAHRQMVAYQSMGATPTWTCAPYQTSMKPVFGQQIAWGESNAICFANSVIGARTERYPDLYDVCAAITGRVPAIGLHCTEHRAGQMHIRLHDVPRALQLDDEFYPVLGHLIGRVARDCIPVITGIDVHPAEDQLKAFCAAMASSGAVALCHVVGVTPEAPTLEAALHGSEPRETVDITMDDLRSARRELTTAEGEALDMVVLGSPHFSIAEFQKLAPLLKGKKRHADVQMLVTSSRLMTSLAERNGTLETLREFGGTVTVDTCVLTTPMLYAHTKTLMTNSAKYAYYAPGLLNTQVVFGSTEDCVRSAIAGRVVRNEGLWRE